MSGPSRAQGLSDLVDLAGEAGDEAIRVAVAVLRDDAAHRGWRNQLGPCFSQAAVADLLGLTPQGVAKRAAAGDLLRLTHHDGRPVYPTFQFDGRRVVAGLGPVVRALAGVDDSLTIASWLTIPKQQLGGRTPLDALRAGNAEDVLGAALEYLARSS